MDIELDQVTRESVMVGKFGCVVYVPSHIKDKFPDGIVTINRVMHEEGYPNGCQFGFVTSFRDDLAFVRYFYPKRKFPVPQKYRKLRNRANSEGTYYHNIYHCWVIPARQIELTMKWIEREEAKMQELLREHQNSRKRS